MYWNSALIAVLHLTLYGKKLDSDCATSYECFDKLVCIKGRCLCSEQHNWNGTHCETIRLTEAPCRTASDCGNTLICSHGKCQCAQEDYWNKRVCSKRKHLTSTCETSLECFGKLMCINERCLCGQNQQWNGTDCKTINIPISSCTTKSDCGSTFICSHGSCQCAQGDFWNGQTCSKYIPRECEDLDADFDGVYPIYPLNNLIPVFVYCKIEHNKKWTVIQRRYDESVDFYRTWKEYKTGFGSVFGEYWLGNDAIHAISDNGQHELSIYMAIGSTHHTANYSTFHVGNEKSKYMLTVSGWSGTIADSMSSVGSTVTANGQKFSTKDRDNDNNNSGSCAVTNKGGWWYNNCFYSDFNRKYSSGMYWAHWSSGIKKSILMIRKS